MLEHIPVGLKKIIDSTAIIFVLSVSSYLIAYATEVGYLRVFGINYQSAQVQTESFVIAFFLLACVGYGGRVIVRDIRNTKRDFMQSRIGRVSFIHTTAIKLFDPAVAINIILAAMICFIFRQTFVVFLALAFIMVFFTLIASAHRTTLSAEKNVYLLFATTATLGLAIISVTIGAVYGHLEVTFKTFTYKNRDYVVVREYRGHIIAKSLTDGQLTNEVRYVTQDSYKDIVFTVVDMPGLVR